jgi:O-antigen ligase
MLKRRAPTMISAMRRAVAALLRRLYDTRGWIITVAAVGAGMGLAFGLCSPLRDLIVAIAGVSVYCAVILIDPLKGLVLWMVTQRVLWRDLSISLGAGIPDLSLTRICIALIMVLLLARTAIRYCRLQPLNKLDAVAFLFMLGMLQSGFRGRRGLSSLQDVFDVYWIPIFAYFVVKNLVTKRRSVHLVLYGVLFIGLYSAVYAIYESTTGNVLFEPATLAQRHAYYRESGLHILRGIWGGNGGFGKVFVMSIPINFYFYLKASSPVRKAIWAICLALVFVGLYLTYKRAAWLGMLVVVFLMQCFFPQFRRLFIVLAVVVGVAFALNWDKITTSTVYTDRVNSKVSTSEDRTEAWENALEFWSARPLLGHGSQQYERLASEAGYRRTAIESEYMDILVSAGLAGFLPYVGMLVLMVYDGLQHYRGRVAGSLADRDLIAVFWGILVGYAVTISTEVTYRLIIPALLFAVAGAIVYARREAPSTQRELGHRSVGVVSSASS